MCLFKKKNVCVAFHLHFLYPIYFPKCIYFCLPFTHFCIIMQMRGAVSQLSSWRLVFAIITGPRFVRCQDIICVVNLKIVLQFTVWDGRGALTFWNRLRLRQETACHPTCWVCRRLQRLLFCAASCTSCKWTSVHRNIALPGSGPWRREQQQLNINIFYAPQLEQIFSLLCLNPFWHSKTTSCPSPSCHHHFQKVAFSTILMLQLSVVNHRWWVGYIVYRAIVTRGKTGNLPGAPSWKAPPRTADILSHSNNNSVTTSLEIYDFVQETTMICPETTYRVPIA